MKEKMGISIDRDVAENLNNVVEVLKDLKISKSEVIETILVAYGPSKSYWKSKRINRVESRINYKRIKCTECAYNPY